MCIKNQVFKAVFVAIALFILSGCNDTAEGIPSDTQTEQSPAAASSDETAMQIFEYEESKYVKDNLYYVLSLLCISLIDLGVIEVE